MRSVVALCALVVLFSGVLDRPSAMEVQVSVTFSELNHHGEWYKLPGLGWVWAPSRVGPEWRPFMDGHWAWTSDNGWLWVSDHPFGWIVCHYGHWHYSSEFGWLWVPGYEWSPARVQWYVTDYDVAWAPLPPPGRHLPPAFKPEGTRHWVVVPSNSFTAPQIRKVHVVRKGSPPGRPPAVVRKGPPDVKVIRRNSRGPMKVFAIDKTDHPVQGRKLVKYKLREQAVGRAQPPGQQKKVIIKQTGPAPKSTPPGHQKKVIIKQTGPAPRSTPPGHQKKVIVKETGPKHVPPGQQKKVIVREAEPQPEPAPHGKGLKKGHVKQDKKAADVDAAAEELKAKQEKEKKEQEGEEESELEKRSRGQEKKKAAKQY